MHNNKPDMSIICLHIYSIVGATVELLIKDNDQFQGIFIQDREMQQIFSAYPEIIFIDATYKLLELRFPVYVLLV